MRGIKRNFSLLLCLPESAGDRPNKPENYYLWPYKVLSLISPGVKNLFGEKWDFPGFFLQVYGVA